MQERTVRHYGFPSVHLGVLWVFFLLKSMCNLGHDCKSHGSHEMIRLRYEQSDI